MQQIQMRVLKEKFVYGLKIDYHLYCKYICIIFKFIMEESECIYEICNREKINSKACKYHNCDKCCHLYDNCNYVRMLFGKLHAITEESNIEIAGYGCPNMILYECASLKRGYTKSIKCIGSTQSDKICNHCYNENKCRCKHHQYMKMRSTDPIIYKNGFLFCDNCITYGKCLNCDDHWFYTIDPEEEYRSYKAYMPIKGPPLCKKCIFEYKACNKCNRKFDNDSIEFLSYDRNEKNICINCIMYTDSYGTTLIRKSGLLCWKIKCVSFLEPIKIIYEKFNPNEVSFNNIFELSLILLWGCRNREIYFDSIINTVRCKNFTNRFMRINKNMQITYNDKYSVTDEYKNFNLLALLVRCALLPNEIFFIILNMI